MGNKTVKSGKQTIKEKLEGAKPLQKTLLPLSLIGEGDTGGEVG